MPESVIKRWENPKWQEYRKAWRKENRDKVRSQNERGESRRRAWRFRTEYRINLEIYADMLKAQDGKCAICLRPQTDFKNRFAVDHNHSTNEIRGLLCFVCNTKLSVIEDSLFMIKAKEYLKRGSDAV